MSAPTASYKQLLKDFRRLASPKKAKAAQWFFKTAPGQYGHGDLFLGVTVPEQRQLVRRYRALPLATVVKLLRSPYHEHRLTAVLILNEQFRRGDETERREIYQAYLRSTRYINNWDIVDSSAPHVVGTWLLERPRKVLYRLARSKHLWDRRIAILATQTFIRQGQFADSLAIAKILLKDKHDLMHKAVGWMLREVGDRGRPAEERFLQKHAARMPRTMLRYAIEKFPARQRQTYLRR